MKYIYIAMRNGEKVAGIVEARHSLEAQHNAKIEAFMRGASVRLVPITSL